MKLEWDLSYIPDSEDLCWEYAQEPDSENPESEGWELSSDGSYTRMNPRTYGIIQSSRIIRLSHLKPSNLEEWIYRINSLYDAGISFLSLETPEGDVPFRIVRHDLIEHIGLKTSALDIPDQKFDKVIRNLRMRSQLTKDDI